MIAHRRALLAALPLLAAPAILRAEETRPLRIVVPFPAGGGVDVFARPFAAALSAVLNQTVVIENQGGASSRLGTGAFLRAPADGNSLLISNDTLAAIEALPVPGGTGYVGGLAPVLLGISAPQAIITHPRSGIADAQAFAERLRSRRSPIIGIPGIGSSQHFAAALLAQAVGGSAEYVPYRGGGPIVSDLLSGVLDAGAVTLGIATELIRDGRLRGLTVLSAARHPVAPEVPTAAETVAPGFEALTWIGVLAPAATRRETVARLHAAGAAALDSPALRARFAGLGYDIVAGDPARFGQVLRETVARFAAVAPVARIRADEA